MAEQAVCAVYDKFVIVQECRVRAAADPTRAIGLESADALDCRGGRCSKETHLRWTRSLTLHRT